MNETEMFKKLDEAKNLLKADRNLWKIKRDLDNIRNLIKTDETEGPYDEDGYLFQKLHDGVHDKVCNNPLISLLRIGPVCNRLHKGE